MRFPFFCLNVMGRKRRIVPAEGKTDMKKSVISTGIALVVLTAGIQFWGYHQVKTGNLYQDQLHAAQKEIGELEDEIQTEQSRIQEIENDLGRIGDELTLHENAAKLGKEKVIGLFESNDLVGQNVMLYQYTSWLTSPWILDVEKMEEFDFDTLPAIDGNEMAFSGGIRFVSESGDRGILKLAGFYYANYVEECKVYPFSELKGWKVVFTDSGLEQLEGDPCMGEEHSYCVLNEETQTVYLSGQSDFNREALFHGICHIVVKAHSDEKDFQEMGARLYGRRYEYAGGLVSPTLHLADQDEFMAEMIQGAINEDFAQAIFDSDMETYTFLRGGLDEQ